MKSLFALFFYLTLGLFPKMGQTADYTVVIEGMKYEPGHVTVKLGDKITWVNKDFYPHTVSALNKNFDSKSIPAGKSWSYSVKDKGEFNYKCTFHPTMKGVVIVN